MANFGVICSVAEEMKELGKLIEGAPLRTPLTEAEKARPAIPLLSTTGYVYDDLHSSRLKLDTSGRTSITNTLRFVRTKIDAALRSKGLEIISLHCVVRRHNSDVAEDVKDPFRVGRWHVDFKSGGDKVFVAWGRVANLQIFEDPTIPTETSEERDDEEIDRAVARAMTEGRGRVIDVAQGDVMLFDPNTIHRRGPFLDPRSANLIRTTISTHALNILERQG